MWFRSDESVSARWTPSAHADSGHSHSLGARAAGAQRTHNTYLTALAVLQAIGLIGSMMVLGGQWYSSLNLPVWALTQQAMMAGWTVLIVSTGVAVLGLHKVDAGDDAEADAARRRALMLVNAQLLLCGFWLASFFVAHLLGVSFAVSCTLWLLTVFSVAAFMELKPAAGWLLAPQLLWFSYLLVLSGVIWLI